MEYFPRRVLIVGPCWYFMTIDYIMVFDSYFQRSGAVINEVDTFIFFI